MPTYQVPNSKGEKWGLLKSHMGLPASSPKALGAGLDLAVAGLQLIENQLLIDLGLAFHADVRKALYLYFNIPLQGSKALLESTVGEIINVLRTTRKGLEDEFGKLEIVQNEDGRSPTLNGYVIRNALTGAVGPIHINFPKIMGMQADLGFGGAYWAGLLVHEATHRYAATTDLVGKVRRQGQDNTDGYLSGSIRGNTIAQFTADLEDRAADAARRRVAGDKIDHITTAQHLTNADSYTWFFIAMLQAYDTTLPISKKFNGIYRDFQSAAARFVQVQRETLAADAALSAMADILNIVYYAPA
ncbi:hypothetical protein [Corallococcus llansteffanensis]|uniref:Uncharacterized protein n=1 Tax=Corallococcus llansteffanensis TaxID=2316731 RepID=A0A3A8QAI2_9BACT|nr:hypothetical protein [Corallococcus llansteffanensis]RKH65188.1 hypothetical protein D7V93_06385 [Corallococcus llansteffanensis]